MPPLYACAIDQYSHLMAVGKDFWREFCDILRRAQVGRVDRGFAPERVNGFPRCL
jgi:hypothetical protein